MEKDNKNEEEVISKENENKEDIILEEKPQEEMEKKEEVKENKIENIEKEMQENEDKEDIILEEETQEEIEEKEKLKPEIKNNPKTKHIIIIFFIIIIILLFFSTIFAILNINTEKIIKGIYIENLEISNLSQDELSKLIKDKIKNIEELEIKCEEYSSILKLEDIGLEIDAKNAIEKAIKIGKTNNIIIDNYSILKANIFKTKLSLDININEEKFDKAVKDIQVELPEALIQYSYEIKGKKLIITNGKSGKSINKEELKKEILNNIKNQLSNNNEIIEIPVKNEKPEEINIEKIYQEIHKEAKDAYIVEEPFEVHKEEEGIDFKISIEEAKQMLKESKQEYTIPLNIIKPKVKIEDLGEKLFKQTLAKYTTIYDSSNTNRASNISLAAKTINGTIILPGETFSYNGKLGNTTAAKGYKLGGAYVGGKIIQAAGGGICQVSTTLYNAVLYANLNIVERHNHSYAVSYVPAGRDATVAYGGKDFKFKNSRTYPIKIVSNAKNGVVSITLKGIKEKKEYEIELSSNVLSTTTYQTTYEDNNNLEIGKQKVIQKGHGGYKSIAYKITKYGGKTISKAVLSKDTYKPMNRIIQIGTKAVAAQTQPTEQPLLPATQ